MNNPYASLPESAFWKTAVATQNPLSLPWMYQKKFTIDQDTSLMTAGSCFAQHITKILKTYNFNILDFEPAPHILPKALHRKYGYGLYSCRYGNIYTVRQFYQLIAEAFGEFFPEDVVWEKGKRFFDALRPNIEPSGYSTKEEVLLERKQHIHKVRKLLESADVIIFTLGLTEAWEHADSGTIFPTVPGSIAGNFSKLYKFHNFTFPEVIDDFEKIILILNKYKNKETKFILTVSPVPLTATYSQQNVLVATTYSKSVLRSVAGFLYQRPNFDYFPSFEILNNCWSRGVFYESNLRTITSSGVNIAMRTFMNEHMVNTVSSIEKTDNLEIEDAVCEEMMLDEFFQKKS